MCNCEDFDSEKNLINKFFSKIDKIPEFVINNIRFIDSYQREQFQILKKSIASKTYDSKLYYEMLYSLDHYQWKINSFKNFLKQKFDNSIGLSCKSVQILCFYSLIIYEKTINSEIYSNIQEVLKTCSCKLDSMKKMIHKKVSDSNIYIKEFFEINSKNFKILDKSLVKIIEEYKTDLGTEFNMDKDMLDKIDIEMICRYKMHKFFEKINKKIELSKRSIFQKIQKTEIYSAVKNSVEECSNNISKIYDSNKFVTEISDKVKSFLYNTNTKFSSEQYFICNSINFIGLNSDDMIKLNKSLNKCFLTKKNKVCHRKYLFNDILFLKKTKLFKNIKVYVCKNNQFNNGYDIFFKLQKFQNDKIRKISFSYANLLPNYIKNLIISEFTGKESSLTNLSIIKHTLDSWYSKWDYLGSHVDSIKKISSGYYQIYVKEIFIDSINFFLMNYDEYFFSPFYKKDIRLSEDVQKRDEYVIQDEEDFDIYEDPATTIFLKLCSSKVGQPYDSNLDEVCFEFEDEVAFSTICVPLMDDSYDIYDESLDEAYTYFREENKEKKKEKKELDIRKVNFEDWYDNARLPTKKENKKSFVNSPMNNKYKFMTYNDEFDINPVFLDILVFSEICDESSIRGQTEIFFPRHDLFAKNELKKYRHFDVDDFLDSLIDVEWCITTISDKIEMITIHYQNYLFFANYVFIARDDLEFEIEYFLPFFNVNSDSALSSMFFLLFNETGCVVLQDMDDDYDNYIELNDEIYLSHEQSYSAFNSKFLDLKNGIKKDYFLYNETKSFNDRKTDLLFDYLDYDDLEAFFYGNTDLFKLKNYKNSTRTLIKEKDYLQKNLNLLTLNNNLILSNEYFRKKIENDNLLNDIYQTKIKYYISNKFKKHKNSLDSTNINPEHDYDKIYQDFAESYERRGKIWELEDYPEELHPGSKRLVDAVYPEFKDVRKMYPRQAFLNNKKIYKESESNLYYFKKYYQYSPKISYYTYIIEPEIKFIDGLILNNISKKNKKYTNKDSSSKSNISINKNIFKVNISKTTTYYSNPIEAFFARKYEIYDKIDSYLNNSVKTKRKLSKNSFYDKDFDIEDDLITYKSGVKLILDEKINLRSKYVTAYTLNYIIFTDEYLDDEAIEEFYTGSSRNSTKTGNINRDGYLYTTSLQNLDVKISTQGCYVRNSLKLLSGTIIGSKLLFFMELGCGINGIYGKTILDLTNYNLINSNFIKKIYYYINRNINIFRIDLKINQIRKKIEKISVNAIQYYLNLPNKKKIGFDFLSIMEKDFIKKIYFYIKGINAKITNINEIFFNVSILNSSKLFNELNNFHRNIIKKNTVVKKIKNNMARILHYDQYSNYFNQMQQMLFNKFNLIIKEICKNPRYNKTVINNKIISKHFFFFRNTSYMIKRYINKSNFITYSFWGNNINLNTKKTVKINKNPLKIDIIYFLKNIINKANSYNLLLFDSYFIMSLLRKTLNLVISPYPLTLVNHIKLGYSFGHIPFYEGFLMGGPYSVRGYKRGEIGLSKYLLQSSFELRYLKNPFLDAIFLFLDYCSDLNSSEHLVYNPSDYKLCCGQGSSIGLGFFLGEARVEYGFNTTSLKNFINFEYGERY
uniref:Outer plastid envelop protein 75 n=1 Tax=Lotharella vacuolata TaxID=74820 RepID=A0A0H5BH01_9EUKA|nr:outer plastid envelop protein 75 [Lotharella vacuolata]